MSRLNLRIVQTIWCVLLLAVSANGANLTVKSGGGGNYTTIQACANAMAAGDTCTVYAGTYNENVTIPAGTAGNYKTITVNGSDIVSVLGFTLNSHTKLIGNCPSLQGTVITATCGFFISNPSSPNTAGCVELPNSTTDVYIKANVMYACGNAGNGLGMINVASGSYVVTFAYIQGNTLSYPCITQAQAGTAVKECNGIRAVGNHWLIENNDLSHYTLGIYFSGLSNSVHRNNQIHDEYETEAGGNAHTDSFFAEPSLATKQNVVEGNTQYNGFGTDAKGILTQGEGCAGNCDGVIFRYNVIRDLDSANATNECAGHTAIIPCFTNVKFYNNTYSNIGRTCTSCFGGNSTSSNNSNKAADLNNIYYFGFAIPNSGFANPVSFDSTTSPGGNWGHDLAYCDASGASNCSLFGHIYQQGTWAGEPGNILGYQNHSPVNNPNFVNLSGKDFHLQASSPAIGAGTYLTTVAAGDSGSGTSLVVNDASYFQDGYGLSNAYSTVQGDCIAVGTASNHVCVTAVNYATNTLTLASSISRSAGQGVYLYSKSDGVQVLTGSAPDMGAYPYGVGAGSNPPAPPLSLSAVVN